MENNSIIAVPIGEFYWFGCPVCGTLQCEAAYEFKEFEVRNCKNQECGSQIGLYHEGAQIPSEYNWQGIQPVCVIDHPAKAGASDQLLREARLAMIKVQVLGKWFGIVTTRYYGETKRTISARLEAELERHQIAHHKFLVEMSGEKTMLYSLVIDAVDDTPGAASVKMKCSLVVEHKFHLPRDPSTHEFIDLPLQTQCLSILCEK